MSAFTSLTSVTKTLALGIALGMPLSVAAFPASAASNTETRGQATASLQPGDLVRLRSGGPLMTVNDIRGNMVYCFWTGLDGEPNAENFPAAVLKKF